MRQDIQQQLLAELVIESLEGLDAFDSEMLALEEGTGSTEECLRNAFRYIHTVKGSSGCLGLTPVEKVAHAAENVMSSLREGRLPVTREVITGLLRSSDRLRDMMRIIENGGRPDPNTDSDLLSLLNSLQNLPAPPDPAPFGFFDEDAHGSASSPAFGFFDDEVAVEIPAAQAMPPTPITQLVQPPEPEKPEPEKPTENRDAALRVSENAIRVDVTQIDRLMNLVGELVLARNQIVQYAGACSDAGLLGPVQRVNLITTELQESVMKTRMQPVQNAWSKFPRLVRDLSIELNKQVALSMEGQDTELDRTVIEAIKDPLTHIVRNAIDHGLERTDERLRAGKPATGSLRLRAFHEGGQVILEICDDGRGIDPQRILRRAIERNLISGEEAGRLGEQEILKLIFLPGFSTAEKVTNLSGRGVGMDVVRTNIERIGGTVEVNSVPGRGTNLRIKIPLTLAIIPAIMIRSGGGRFAIPQASVTELVRLDAADTSRRIEYVDRAPVFRMRGALLPLVSLAEKLRLPATAAAEETYLVVLEAEGCKFGLIVDGIDDTEEIVVKPLARAFKGLGVYAGATILGDGRVALILDSTGLARSSGLLKASAAREMAKASATLTHSSSTTRLLMANAGGTRIGVPLEEVTRLEEIPSDRLERSGRRLLLQYRGGILPLFHLAEMMDAGSPPAAFPELLRVIVTGSEAQSAGVVIDDIEDIVEDKIELHDVSGLPGVEGSLIVGGKIACLISMKRLLAQAGFGTPLGGSIQ